MSDYVQVSIDYGQIRAIVNSAVSPVAAGVMRVQSQVAQAQDDIIRLQRELADFRKQQEFAAALQRPIRQKLVGRSLCIKARHSIPRGLL